MTTSRSRHDHNVLDVRVRGFSFILVVILLGLGLAPSPVQAKRIPRIEQVVEIEYLGTTGVGGLPPDYHAGGICVPNPTAVLSCRVAAPRGPARKGSGTKLMRFVRIEVEDVSGQTVGGFLTHPEYGEFAYAKRFGAFCGPHDHYLPLPLDGRPIEVFLKQGLCDDTYAWPPRDPTPSVVTQGTIRVTFSNLP